jgi:hypothetical protein
MSSGATMTEDRNDKDPGMRSAPATAADPVTESRTTPYASPRSGTDWNKSTMLTGSFSDRDTAERAWNSLTSRGYTDKEINVMMSDDVRKKYFADDNSELGNKAAEGGTAGAVIGGSAGAILGALTAAGTLALPGLGLIIAGPIAAALAGLGVGGAAGGLVGALIGAGIPEDRAKEYEKDIKEGRIVMGVRPRSEADATHFHGEWKDLRANNVYY